MAYYTCEGCALQENCKHAYESFDCIYSSIEDNPKFKADESLFLLGKLLDIFKSNNMESEVYSINCIINDLEYYYSEDLKNEYNELIKD